jgi:NAD(P)-dependent dehydrogenase (short-subunit alcohol dehydrogenase family)
MKRFPAAATRALVTGASNGIGRAISVELARAGYDLALADEDRAWHNDLVHDPELAARNVFRFPLELRSRSSIIEAFAQALEALGSIDVLVNNASRMLQKPALDTTWSDWDDVLDGNLKGAFFLSVQFARHCLAHKRQGAIVNVASTHGMFGVADRAAYGVAKAGLIHLTRALAVEWAPHGIRVNAVAPAAVPTTARGHMLGDAQSRERRTARIPSGNLPTAEDVAGAVLYLLGPGAGAVTGHTLVVDGGMTAAG